MQALNGKAWNFDSQFLFLKPWSEETDFLKDNFNRVQLWVQVWNIPNHWLSKKIGFKFKKLLCDVIDGLVPESGSKKVRHMKILAEFNLERPLLGGTKIKYQDQEVWVKFKYENIAKFFFYCGKVGHSERICIGRKGHTKAGKLAKGQYWLKEESVKASPKLTSVIDKEKLDWDGVGDQNAGNYRHDRGKLGIVATNVPPINIDIGLDGKVGVNAVEDKVSEQEMGEKEVNQDIDGGSEIEKITSEW